MEVLRWRLSTFTFSADREETWPLLIEQFTLPNRSTKSRDAGRNWDDESLDINDVCDGEYMIRLKLDQYATCGVMASSEIDLGTLVPEDGTAVPLKTNQIRGNLHADQPNGTPIDLKYRFGSTHEYDLRTWTDWYDATELMPVESLHQLPDVPRYPQ